MFENNNHNNSSYYYFSNFTSTYNNQVSYFYAYAHPVITWLAAFMNIICAIVFVQRELLKSGPFFKYSLINSIGAAIGMIILSWYSLTRCGNLPLCSTAYTYEAQAVELYAIYYIGNSLYLGGSLIQIAISVQLYLTITQKLKRLANAPPFGMVLGFAIVSICLGIALIFSFKIRAKQVVTVTRHNEEEIRQSKLVYQIFLDSSNSILTSFTLFVIIISNKIFLCILIIINILLYVELRKMMRRKQTLVRIFVTKVADLNTKRVEEQQEESQRKTLVMVLWVSVVFSSSRLVYAVTNLVLLLMEGTVFNLWLNVFNNTYGACVYISYFFVYMTTNKLFRKTFYRIFLRRDFK